MRPGEKHTITLEDLSNEARAFWRELPNGAVVWLSGELGTGKTTFASALANAAGADPARSPTFSLVHEYESPEGTIFHADCYRLETPDDALDPDFPGILKTARLLLIEWPERAGSRAPRPDVSLQFSHADDPNLRMLERVS